MAALRRLALLVALVALAAGLASVRAGAAAAADWCGTDEVAADRLPDLVSGRQVHVVYAYPSDAPDHFADSAQAIARDVAAIDRWWRGQDATRTLRFDLFAFPGCSSSSGSLDISSLRLPGATAYYDVDQQAQSDRLDSAVGSAFPGPYKKVLVYYDGPASQLPNVCGYSPEVPGSGGGSLPAIVLLQQGCGPLGVGGYVAETAAHELLHNLGALPPPPGPAHGCPGDTAHACDDPSDIMSPGGRSTDLGTYLLDAGRDDYYGHGGHWLDTRDSAWLTRLDVPEQRLTVRFAGSAAGSVSADLPGLACTAACAVDWEAGTAVSLSATTSVPGASFLGWSGGCTGTGSCDLVLDGPRDVTARFEQTVRLRVSVAGRGGSGEVSVGAESCTSGSCSFTVVKGSLVDLRPAPGPASRLLGWTGACTGQGGCSVVADGPKSVTAVFGPARLRVAVRVTGRGRVTGPAGISCPARCAASVRFGLPVALHARPGKGSRFVRWTGACRGAGACRLEPQRAVAVGAVFARTR